MRASLSARRRLQTRAYSHLRHRQPSPAGKASAAVHTAPALGAGVPLASRDGTRGLSADRATIGHILTGLRALPGEEGLARYIAP